jgi:Phage integrase family
MCVGNEIIISRSPSRSNVQNSNSLLIRSTILYAHRDSTLILLIDRHGLRVAEASALQWTQIDFNGGTIYVKRVKKGTPSVQPLYGDEIPFMPICCGMERVTIWRTEVLILGQFRVTWGITIFNIQCVIPNLLLLSFKGCGMVDCSIMSVSVSLTRTFLSGSGSASGIDPSNLSVISFLNSLAWDAASVMVV